LAQALGSSTCKLQLTIGLCLPSCCAIASYQSNVTTSSGKTALPRGTGDLPGWQMAPAGKAQQYNMAADNHPHTNQSSRPSPEATAAAQGSSAAAPPTAETHISAEPEIPLISMNVGLSAAEALASAVATRMDVAFIVSDQPTQ